MQRRLPAGPSPIPQDKLGELALALKLSVPFRPLERTPPTPAKASNRGWGKGVGESYGEQKQERGLSPNSSSPVLHRTALERRTAPAAQGAAHLGLWASTSLFVLQVLLP